MLIIISILLTYIIGIISCEINLNKVIFLFFLFIITYIIIKKKRIIYSLVLIVFFLLAIINYNYNSQSVLLQYIGKEALIEAKIINNTNNSSSYYDSYYAKIFKINDISLHSNEKIILYIEKNNRNYNNSIVKLSGTISEISCQKNKLIFNYKKYLRNNKIHAVVNVSNRDIRIIENDYSTLKLISEKFKVYTEKLFYSKLEKDNANIILSVILGDKSYLSKDFLDSIRNIGLAHIFAISGLHIGILYTVLRKIFKFIKCSKKKNIIFTFTVLWFYGFLIGFPISVLRTLLMFTILFGSELFYRKYNSLNSIAVSALILLIINPFWLFDVGFQLSFIATFALIIYSKYIYKKIKVKNKIINSFYLFVFLQISLLPVLAYHFNYVPILGIIYNIIFIPFFTIILIIGYLSLLIGYLNFILVDIIFFLLNFLINSMCFLVELLNKLSINGIKIYSINFFETFVYYFFIVIAINIKKIKSNRIKVYVFIILFFIINNYFIISFINNNLYLNIIDVGQGLGTVVTYNNKNFIIDAGSSSVKNIGEYTILPYIIKNGFFNIKGLFISHWHNDHYSGLFSLLNKISINGLFSGYINDDIILVKEIILLKKGNRIKVSDNLTFEILWPEKDYINSNENNMSQVIIIKYNDFKILFTGDIEKEIEKRLVDYGIENVDILIVPHHGSNTSSTKDFIKKLNPKYAIFSYGKNNYGIPSKKVLNSYKNLGSRVFETFYDGEIKFIINEKNIYYELFDGKNNKDYRFYIQSLLNNVIIFLLTLYYNYFLKKVEESNHELL